MDFNIASYPGADSIVFGGFPITTDATVKCVVELYDLTELKLAIRRAIEANHLRLGGKNNLNLICKGELA